MRAAFDAIHAGVDALWRGHMHLLSREGLSDAEAVKQGALAAIRDTIKVELLTLASGDDGDGFERIRRIIDEIEREKKGRAS